MGSWTDTFQKRLRIVIVIIIQSCDFESIVQVKIGIEVVVRVFIDRIRDQVAIAVAHVELLKKRWPECA